jgi:hypothetical protein
MAAAKDLEKTLQIGDVATFEVVTPHCGLVKGEKRRMKVTRELLYCIDAGLWKQTRRK